MPASPSFFHRASGFGALLVDRVWHVDAGQSPAIPEDLGSEAAMGSNSPKKSHRGPPGCHSSTVAGWASSE